MGIFSDVTLEWRGEEYVIPCDRVMRLIATVEEHIGIQDLATPDGIKLTKLAQGYAAALAYAGCKPASKDTPLEEEIYLALFDAGRADAVASTLATGIIMLMVPPEKYTSGMTEPKKKRENRKPKD